MFFGVVFIRARVVVFINEIPFKWKSHLPRHFKCKTHGLRIKMRIKQPKNAKKQLLRFAGSPLAVGVFLSADAFVSRSGGNVTQLPRGQSSEMVPPWVQLRSACYLASTSTRQSPSRRTRQGRRHPLRGQLRHLPPTPRQHRRRAARRRATRAAGNAMNAHQAQRGHGRDHGADNLRRHRRHLEHRDRGGACTPPEQ